jgi:replicative DNA helicase
MLELEGRAVADGLDVALLDAITALAGPELAERLADGYQELTPSGGTHFLYRCPGEIEGNLKLARRVGPNDEIEVLIETRGEGGFTVAAPSWGTVHPTGKAWEMLAGGVDTIPTVTPEERAHILQAARSLDQMPEAPPPAERLKAPLLLAGPSVAGATPLEDVDHQVTGDQVLERNGFTLHHEDGRGRHFTRPGKDPRHGSSATVWSDNGTTTLFSSAIDAPPEFIDRRQLRPSQLVAALEHGGDFAAAASQARRDGYGAPSSRPDDDLHSLIGALGPAASLVTSGSAQEPPTPMLDPDDPGALAALLHSQPVVRGGSFILDSPETVPAIWGSEDHVAWAAGEPLYIVGPSGVGKTTLVGQLHYGRLGLMDDVLGYPVEPGAGRVLYLACDRPRQISRALHRLTGEEHREILDEKLMVHRGPPLADLAAHPEHLVWLARMAGADTVILDSLKDVASPLSDDKVGSGLNKAVQLCVAADIEVLGLHHQRKSGADGGKPKTLSDVYGSMHITAGAGSVMLLWGQAGDPVVDLVHLKQPATQLPAMKIEHDHSTGISTVWRQFDMLQFLRNQRRGASAIEGARQMFEKAAPTRAQEAKARRELDQLVKKGFAFKQEPQRGGRQADGTSGATPARYFMATEDPGGLIAEPTSGGQSETAEVIHGDDVDDDFGSDDTDSEAY